MGNQRHQGFTIIEVMLFLAVSAALAIGILAGSSLAINQQRYRDSLNSLQSLLKQQYSETTHVINDRDDPTISCNSSGVSDSGTPQSRGTSECLVLGRYVTITDDGKTIAIASVVGIKPDNAPGVDDDLSALQQYELNVSTNTEVSEVAWGSSVKDLTPPGLAILILRSPLTGAIRTFTGTIPTGSTSIKTLVTQANVEEKRLLCLDSDSIGVNTQLGVMIRANAADPSAIELVEGDSGC